MLLLNRIFVPSPPKGRKRRGDSANTETVFARTRRENIARRRRKTVAESSPARDVSSGQGAAAFFQMKKAPFSRSLFVGINHTFVPSSPKGRKRRGGQRECRDGFRPIEAREHRPRTQGDGRREQPGERCFGRVRRGGAGIAALFQAAATQPWRKRSAGCRERRASCVCINTPRNRDPARGRYPRPAREAWFPNWRSRGRCSAGGAPASARRRKAPRRSWPRPREGPMR